MNWKSIETRNIADLDKFYWEQGFFYAHFNTKNEYVRDFGELMLRDLALFTFPEIRDKVILDMGCGSGLYSLTFLKMGAKLVCGQDISGISIRKNTERAYEEGFQNFNGKAGDCRKLQFDDNYFDYVFAGDVFEHLDQNTKRAFIAEAFRVLKPGGIFTVKTPNKSYLKITNFLHRMKALLRLKNPMKIHIAHTRNNPDNEHHGLVTHRQLNKLFKETMFHDAIITLCPLKKRIPIWLSIKLGRLKFFNQSIILSARKPIFFGTYY